MGCYRLGIIMSSAVLVYPRALYIVVNPEISLITLSLSLYIYIAGNSRKRKKKEEEEKKEKIKGITRLLHAHVL